MILEAKAAIVTGTVAFMVSVAAATQQSIGPAAIGIYIAFGSLLIGGVSLLIVLLRGMSSYGREQGEMQTQIANLQQQLTQLQLHQISGTEVKLMMENTSLKIDALTTRLNEWTQTVTYDLRRLRESHRHAMGQAARDEPSDREDSLSRREGVR